MDDELSEALRQLSRSVGRTIEEGISNGTLRPEEVEYFRWKVNNPQYTDRGVIATGAQGESIYKQSWSKARRKVEEITKQSGEYARALGQLASVFGKKEKPPQDIDYFVRALIRRYFHEPQFSNSNVDALITTFLKELCGEPLKHGARVELKGIELQLEKIEPDIGVTLRQPKIEDYEKESPVYFLMKHDLPQPSAILNVEFLGRWIIEVEELVEQAISILRLFKVGSVKWTSYETYSESVTAGRTSARAGEVTTAHETYVVTQEDVQKLKKFWQTMDKFMPRSLYGLGATKIDYLTIAYNRYSDALLLNGIIERRIMNAIMGLEALFLKTEERQELVYRLKTRISKLLSLFGYNPHEMKRVLRDAYWIRSIFAHGGQLSYDERRKLEEKHKDIKNVLLPVLDYLRISLIVMILSNKGKNELIDLIDESFVDRKREEYLNSVISGAKEFVEAN
jgi:hypothetical protein